MRSRRRASTASLRCRRCTVRCWRTSGRRRAGRCGP
jgi:hypothetical protein